jgi:cystathionine beta-lyase/cystathionine gamma-synthase
MIVWIELWMTEKRSLNMSLESHHIETLSLHAGQVPDLSTSSRAVPVYRTSAYQFRDTQHAANLFALKELGNIYTRLMNPTHDVLEKRMAALEGGAAALALASGTSAIFYSIINLCKAGDEIARPAPLRLRPSWSLWRRLATPGWTWPISPPWPRWRMTTGCR